MDKETIGLVQAISGRSNHSVAVSEILRNKLTIIGKELGLSRARLAGLILYDFVKAYEEEKKK